MHRLPHDVCAPARRTVLGPGRWSETDWSAIGVATCDCGSSEIIFAVGGNARSSVSRFMAQLTDEKLLISCSFSGMALTRVGEPLKVLREEDRVYRGAT